MSDDPLLRLYLIFLGYANLYFPLQHQAVVVTFLLFIIRRPFQQSFGFSLKPIYML